jgi:hypothetical protein
MGGSEVEAFQSHLATEERVSPSTQNQALAKVTASLRGETSTAAASTCRR